MPDYNKDPEFDGLVTALAEKTKTGKLLWSETADENTFVASVKGEQTFEISLTFDGDVGLRVRDQAGEVLYEHQMGEKGAPMALYTLAKRIATEVDDKIEKSLQLLEQL